MIEITRAIRGTEVDFSSKFKRDIQYVIPAVNVITLSDKKRSQENPKTCTRRGVLPPLLTRTSVVSPPHPRHRARVTSGLSDPPPSSGTRTRERKTLLFFPSITVAISI